VPIYCGLPIASKKMIKSKKHCWLPISIMLANPMKSFINK
jgi:hypothetical protein